jgi:hypothetical protein
MGRRLARGLLRLSISISQSLRGCFKCCALASANGFLLDAPTITLFVSSGEMRKYSAGARP